MRLYIVAFAIGVWSLQQQPELPVLLWAVLLAGMAAIACAAWSPGDQPTRLLCQLVIAVLIGVCGFGYAAWRAELRLADALPPAWEGKDIQVVGVVAGLPQPYQRSLRFEFDVEQIITAKAQVPSHLALTWYGSTERRDRPEFFPEVHAGERWQLRLRLRRPHGTLNPHGFDYEAWLLERDIRATGYVRVNESNTRLDALASGSIYWLQHWREELRTRIRGALPDAPYAGVLGALAIGDQRAITPSQWQVFTRTGVNHLMSISGLHVTMVSGLMLVLVLTLWCRSERLTLWLPARKAAVIAGVLAAFAYALLAGFEVPAQRTVYMLTIVACALWSGAAVAVSGVLALALLAVLLIDPWAVNAAGFWLSFSAVALILYVTVGRIRPDGVIVTWLRVQWAITLGLIPLTLALFQQVSLVSPLANAVAIPVVSLLVVPLTLCGMLLPFDAVLQLAHSVMALCGHFLESLNALPVAVWQQHAPPVWAVLAAMIGVLWLLLPRGFPARWLGVAGFMPLFFLAPTPLPDNLLRLTVLDVGQGLAVVAQSGSHALLYDTGPEFGPGADSGNRIIVPFLRAMGIRTLDDMIVSHDDSDHSGGAASVLQAVPVATVRSSLPTDHPAIVGAVRRERCFAGQNWQWEQVHFEILHPAESTYAEEKRKDNDRSCVLKISAPGGSVLLTADIESKSERELLAAGPALDAEVLLVPHHGSRTSSSLDFVAAVHPQIAVFTVGYRNRFGHPKAEVVQRYLDAGSRLYRSDRDSALIIDLPATGAPIVQSWRSTYRRYWLEPSMTAEGAEAGTLD